MEQYSKTVQKMINLDDVVKENIKGQNQNWLQFLVITIPVPEH